MVGSFRYKCLVCPSMGFALRGWMQRGEVGNVAWQLSSFSLAGFFPFCRIILSRPFRPASARDFGGGRRWRRRMDCVLASRYSVRFASHGGVLFRLSCSVAGLRALRSASGSAGVLVMYLFFGGGYVGAGGASSLLPLFGGGARNSFPVGRSVAS